MSAIPEKRAEIFQTLASLAMVIRREKGCSRCELLLESEDQGSLDLLEEWKSRDDLDEHLRSQVFGILLGLVPLLKTPLAMSVYTVAAVEGMEAVKKARTGASDGRS